MREGIAAIAELVRQTKTVAICCHVSPDGDTIGSALALKLAMERLGKRVEVFCADKVPGVMAMLPGAGTVRTYASLALGQRFDLLFPVDTASEDRLGNGVLEQMRVLCTDSCQIDHHGTNPGYCRVNCIDGTAPAAGLIVRELLAALEVPLDRDLACCLYTAISTDTGNFSFNNVTAEAFRVAAELVEAGLPLAEMNRQLFVVQPEAQVRLTARAVEGMKILHSGEVAVMVLKKADFEALEALPEHAENVVNRALAVRGVRMAALLREHEGRVKASLRAVAPYVVSGIAARFGGGGHAQAAGCTLNGPIEEAAARIGEALCAALDEARV
ncbi:MAG: DHH family phosphoesterase [Clostridia bacterium]|nr:DHH family phosphoesterase [Clostridia bacterium]